MRKFSKKSHPQNQLQVVGNVHEEIRKAMDSELRQATLKLIYGMFNEELSELCGPRYSRKSAEDCHRNGSDPGSLILSGQRIAVRKPRVKKEGREVELQSYSALQDFDLLCDKVSRHMINGVSTRNYEGLLDEVSGSLGLKKSTVSKAFKKGSKQILDKINGRDLKAHRFVSLMIDGVGLGERTVVTVLGITDKGKKLILGIREGDTEDWRLCRDLFHNLLDRGFDPEADVLFVIDGGKALRKAIRKLYGDRCPVQRCVRHKERNVLSYLPKTYHQEFRRRFKKLHGMTKFDEAQKEYNSLIRYLGEINDGAAASLAEANMETLTIIKLGVPPLLRKTLNSTNPIESVFDKVKSKSSRVKNWSSGTNQVSRWAATLLDDAEKKFRTLKGYQQIPVLIQALKDFNLREELKLA